MEHGHIISLPENGTVFSRSERFLVHHIWHLGWVAPIVAFQHVDERLDATTGHASVWVDVQACDPRSAREAMKYPTTIRDFRIEQRRIRRERVFLDTAD